MALMAQMMSKGGDEPKTAKQSAKRIRFVNLTNGTVVLRGTVMWSIVGQFNHRDFAEKEATSLLRI